MNSFCRRLRNSRQRSVYFFNVHSLTVCLEESHNVVDCCHLETQALAGTLVYNISKALEAGSALGWKVRCLALCLLWGAWTLSSSGSIFTV